ncbi:MAG: 16S rRNA (uracil(1498)-N(3))-methyltransferase [Clostridia bacterium]|nr:16S rRNA (uracil(1498)-N(3))-methyltransferase [Clostridia bacterium]
MYNFFVTNPPSNNLYIIEGGDFNHVVSVLRKKTGDRILVSYSGKNDLCEIHEIFSDYLTAKIIEQNYLDTELPLDLTLIQGLPKGDKLELIIQKAVELGVNKIIPVQTARSVIKIEDKKKESKRDRWQAISESAGKQSKRSVVPEVSLPLSFKQFLSLATEFDLLLIPYENKNGMADTLTALKELCKNQKVGVFIGPEGGFDQKEIELLLSLPNARVISLGKRILRTETAAICALSCIMLYAEINLND